MPLFFASTSRGLVDVLSEEIQSLGLEVREKTQAGVSFETNWEGCYKANLWLRTATRIIKPVLDFPAYQLDELYHNTLKHDFTKYIEPSQTIAVDAVVRESMIRDQRMVALKVKDAVVDQFRDKFGVRPDVDTRNPALRIMARVVKNQVSLAIDTTGEPLSFRGYRIEAGEAPLREHVAAGVLHLCGWAAAKNKVIVDPMCGSGTFLIEAAMMARNMAPGLMRKRFAFQGIKGFQEEPWSKLVEEAIGAEIESSEVSFYGSDLDREVLRYAKRNIGRAGVDENIEFHRLSVTEIKPPEGVTEPGLILVNPPYGARLGVTEELKDVYRDLAHALKTDFKGWTLWLLSGNEELSAALKLKASRRIPIHNGNIECRLLEYLIK